MQVNVNFREELIGKGIFLGDGMYTMYNVYSLVGVVKISVPLYLREWDVRKGAFPFILTKSTRRGNFSATTPWREALFQWTKGILLMTLVSVNLVLNAMELYHCNVIVCYTSWICQSVRCCALLQKSDIFLWRKEQLALKKGTSVSVVAKYNHA